MTSDSSLSWPPKYDVIGVGVSSTSYDEAVDSILAAAAQRSPAVVSLHAVHAVVTASSDPQLREAVNAFEIVAPDGQPVRWALNGLHRQKLKERVYGPELTLRLCERAAREGVSVYLYGGANDEILQDLITNLIKKYPDLKIAGAESPPFRPLTAEEDVAMVKRINDSGAGIVFIGLGCPKQDHFAHEHRHNIQAVQVCVGAAFDFHAGRKTIAPAWMQRRGLEWLYRLGCEPGRLWKRYLVTNTLFVQRCLTQWARMTFSTAPAGRGPA